MQKITVVPLGPGSPEFLTVGALRAFQTAHTVILRTERHGAVKELENREIRFETLDPLYETCDDFLTLNTRAAQTLWEAALPGPLAYGVADPAEDETVRELVLGAGPGKHVEILPGVSLSSALLCALPEPPIGQAVKIVPASAGPQTHLVPSEALLILELNSRLLAGEIKLWLLSLHNEELEVVFFPPGEMTGRKAVKIPLSDLDRQKAYDHTAAVYVPAVLLSDRGRHDFFDLLAVMERLRAPDGCPWDREQTHESLRPYLLEEAYEAVSAINEGDMDHVADELGDVLLQVVFHAQIACQHGEFDIRDITTAICRKMIARHAHIFGQATCETAEDVVLNWDRIKRKERGLQSQAAVMADVSKHLPALMRAYKVQQKAKQVGFDWDDPKEALSKVREEAQEVLEELDKGTDPGEELGDLLFAVVNVARLCKLQPELLLSGAVEKFIKRFERMEKAIVAEGKALEHLTLSEMDVYWEKGKQLEKKA